MDDVSYIDNSTFLVSMGLAQAHPNHTILERCKSEPECEVDHRVRLQRVYSLFWSPIYVVAERSVKTLQSEALVTRVYSALRQC